jgi:hypothetical protein
MRAAEQMVSHEEVTHLLAYNKHTGELTWRYDRSRTAKAGDEAGTLAYDGTIVVGLKGSIYPASRLIWFYVHGEWPPGRLFFRDGDKANLRFRNIGERRQNLSLKHTAIYQRQRRKIMRRARIRIANDAYLKQIFERADADEARKILAQVADQVKDDMDRNHEDVTTPYESAPEESP